MTMSGAALWNGVKKRGGEPLSDVKRRVFSAAAAAVFVVFDIF